MYLLMRLHECQVSVIPFGWGKGMVRLSGRSSSPHSQCKWISIHWLIEAAESSCKLLLLKFSSIPNLTIQLNSADKLYTQSLHPISDMLQPHADFQHDMKDAMVSQIPQASGIWFKIFKTPRRRKGSGVDWSQQTTESGTFLLLRGANLYLRFLIYNRRWKSCWRRVKAAWEEGRV